MRSRRGRFRRLRQHWATGSNADGGNSIVGSDVAGPTMQDDEVIKAINPVDGLDFAIDDGRQVFSLTA